MSKDAKLGLVLGIAVVIVIAVVFFRKDQSQAKASTETAAASVKPKSTTVPAAPVVSDMRPPVGARQHTVVDGESLFSIAERYYGDRSRFVVLYEANRDRLVTPDRLTAGTVVLVP